MSKVWIVFAVHGDADQYDEISYHKTEEGAKAKIQSLDPEWYAKDEFGGQPPRLQVFSRPLED